MPKKVFRAEATKMSKLTTPVQNPTNGKPLAEKVFVVKPAVTSFKTDSAQEVAVVDAPKPEVPKTAVIKPVWPNEIEKPIIPAPEPKKEMSMLEKILKVENLQLVVEKRAKLVQTRSELERFQISSNDFNCSMRLNDSDGNVFTTAFTPGIKKVIDFLKSSFDASITDVENKITF